MPNASNKTVAERQFKAHGLDCLVLWIGNSYSEHGGHRTGYVRVPDGHPWHGVAYNEDVPGGAATDYSGRTVESAGFAGQVALLSGAVDEWARRVEAHVEVHGGLTYSGKKPNDAAEEGWWFGFDCAHLDDTPMRWDEKAVSDECESLAQQIAAVLVDQEGGEEEPASGRDQATGEPASPAPLPSENNPGSAGSEVQS